MTSIASRLTYATDGRVLTPDELLMAKASPVGFAYIASNGRIRPTEHTLAISEKLVDVAAGRIKRLMIFMPPRHGKSTSISQFFPAWYLGMFPDRRLILTSYEATFAASWGRKARDLVTEWGQDIFGVTVSQNSASATDWDIAGHTGGMNTAGVGGALTGKGGHVLIIDDPIKNSQDAKSDTLRETQWDWYLSTANTRLEADPEGAIILVQTRWHHDDLAGRLLVDQDRGGDQWEILKLPAIAEEDDPLGRAVGEALWPSRIPIERLERIKATGESPRWFNALYQQSPELNEGNMFKTDWLTRHWLPGQLPQMKLVVQSVDSAFKDGVANDYSVIATWGTDGLDYYLLALWRGKVEFPGLVAQIKRQYQLYGPHVVIIEDESGGAAAIPALRQTTSIPIVAFQPTGSKINRADSISPIFESLKVVLPPESTAWLKSWITEHTGFPAGKHDDQVDTTSMALLYLSPRNLGVTYGPNPMTANKRAVALWHGRAGPEETRNPNYRPRADYLEFFGPLKRKKRRAS